AGQAQKETFVNETSCRLDTLVHLAVEASAPTPPANIADGLAWLVAAEAGGEWSGKDGQIASRQSGNWFYIIPRDGLRAYNRATGQELLYSDGWIAPDRPTVPSGGTTVDSEARETIVQIIASLASVGIYPA
ncbi:DUF2793 domain-containing protein, partial [Novosphingobium sp.]|uniref:DUF2793 domain-containing protein n=1 Tax=Novosphingobium sp. TaxID=1874826 RepID=UPI0025E87220